MSSSGRICASSGIEFIEFELNILSRAIPVVRSFFLNSSTKMSDNFSPPDGKINEKRDRSDSDRFTLLTRLTLTVVDATIFSGILEVIDSLPLSLPVDESRTDPTPESDSELISDSDVTTVLPGSSVVLCGWLISSFTLPSDDPDMSSSFPQHVMCFKHLLF